MKITVFLHTGYCGMDSVDFYEINDDYSEEELQKFLWEQALEHAERYGLQPYPEEDEDLDEYCDGDYSMGICGSYEIFDEKEHSKYKTVDKIEFMELKL